MPNKREKIILQLKGFDAAHYRRTEAYARQIDKLCSLAAADYASLAGTLFQPDQSKPFSFDDYPRARKEAQQIINGLAKKIEGVVVRGTEAEWRAACDKNDAFIRSIVRTSKLTPEETAQFQARNLEALQGFQKRKVEGLDLSQRVWKYVGDIKDTMELGIDVALGEGRSAQQLSRDLRECLQEPNKLFRRVRDKYGNLQLSKAARLYHPGQGVYRSSAKNAMRLARTEVNMAYRESEFLRWQQLDFVVGFRVMLSNNHTVLDSKGKPQPLVDICDELAGDYPKTFRFEGWHPQCRCVVVPILSDYDEYNKGRANRLKAIVKGESYKAMPSRRTVTAMPENFTKYVESIADRAKGWKSQPYYIKHNFQGGRIDGGLLPGVATRMNGATTAATQKTVEPCTEFDARITGLKRWAYAMGLDLTKADALRLAGKRNELEAELDRLDEISEKRQEEWLMAYAELQQVRNQISKLNKAVADKYTAICGANRCEAGKYYADCIKNLREAKVAAEADLKKAIEAEAKAGYSTNMPEELKKGKEWLMGDDYVYDKEFFDLIDPKHPIPVTIRPGCGNDSWYDPAKRRVFLDSVRRREQSPYYRKALVYHEFGHGIDWQRDMRDSKEVKDLRATQIARMRKMVSYTKEEKKYDYSTGKYTTKRVQAKKMLAKVLSDRVTAVYRRLNKVDEEFFKRRGITKQDVIEALSAVADTLRTFVNSSDVGWGHSVSYFNITGMKEAEYIAHAFENRFIGNRAFQHFMPTEYAEMIALIKGLKKP